MRYRPCIFAMFPILLCGFLLYSAYIEVKNEAIEQLNNQQMILAKAASRSIEGFFGQCAELLDGLSKEDSIIPPDEQGKRLIKIFYESHANEISRITRVDARGRILYGYPPAGPGLDISFEEHIKRILQTHRPVISDVFHTMDGLQTVAYHVPVFENGVFRGSVGVLIPFDRLAKRHLENIRLAEDGYAWMISRKGVELYCPVPGHVGKTVFENCKDFPDILAMAREMVQGREGKTSYAFDKVRGRTVESVKKHAVYLPIHLGDTFWSIVVATPEREVLGIIQGFRNRLFLLGGILLLTVALSSLYLVRAHMNRREEAKRKRTEEGLRDSERQLYYIIQGFPIAAFVIGKDHRVIYWNKALEDLSGIEAGRAIGTTEHWRAFHDRPRPCLADLLVDGAPDTIGRWYVERRAEFKVSEEKYEATDFFPHLGERGKWFHFSVTAIKNSHGLLVGAIETIEDITERKHAEAALEKALLDLHELNFIVNKSPAIAFLWQAADQWPVEFVSDNIAQFGYSPDEFTSGRIPFASIIHPGDLERIGAEVASYTAQGWTEFTQEYRIITKSGEVRWIDDRTWIRRDGDGQVTHYQGIVFDITERKQVEDALISANQQLNDIIEFLPDATFVIDKDKKVIAWNRAIEEMTGVDKKDMIGREHSACAVPFYGEARPYLLDLIEAGDKDRALGYDHFGYKRSALYAETFVPRVWGGQGATVFATAAPLFDRHGNRVGAIESIRDITESKRKEEALRESQQRLANIIDFLPDATFVIDKEGKVISWNRAIEEMTGVRAADMLGRGEFEYALPFYGERRPILIDLVLMAPEKTEGKYFNVKRKGTLLAGEAYQPALRGGEAYLFGTASALFDSKGNIVGAIESIRDLTERKRVEEALARAEEKYRGIFENSIEGIYQSTLDGRFISVNPAFAQTLGYDSPEEVLHTITNISRQLYVNPELRSGMLRRVATQGMVQKFEAEFFRKDRSIAWVALNVRAVRDKKGGGIYLEGTAEDISERKALEARLVQAQKMEAIGTLAGGIAHDFNNILAPIIGYSELALQEIPEDSQLRRNIEQVLRSGCRAKDLVKQILTFSRKTEREQRPVQISFLIKEALDLLRSSLPTTIEICRNISGDTASSTVMADPTQIHQVLMNLCTNAAHAMREKGGVLTVALERVDAGPDPLGELPDLEDGPYLRLSVSDTGHGMEEGVKRRIFDPYFTTKGPDEGTGLGLAVVYGIVKGLAGGIAVFSRPGEGTTFHVFLPVHKTIGAASADKSSPLPMGRGCILAVDDERHVVEMLKEMLEKLGYEVVARNSSADALETFRAQPKRFDLVITDQTMPHMTGTDLAREMLQIRPDIPIVLCTGFSATTDEKKARAIGIRAFLMKPMALRQLALEVHKALGLS